MIRDPSDGSVKEISPEASKINAVAAKQASKGISPDTGLRQPTRTDAQERLERSREWLKQYQQAVRDANSMNDKGEITNAGRGNSSEQSQHSTDGRGIDEAREDKC